MISKSRAPRFRWTRKDAPHGLINSHMGEVGKESVTFRLADGRTLKMASPPRAAFTPHRPGARSGVALRRRALNEM